MSDKIFSGFQFDNENDLNECRIGTTINKVSRKLQRDTFTSSSNIFKLLALWLITVVKISLKINIPTTMLKHSKPGGKDCMIKIFCII